MISQAPSRQMLLYDTSVHSGYMGATLRHAAVIRPAIRHLRQCHRQLALGASVQMSQIVQIPFQAGVHIQINFVDAQ